MDIYTYADAWLADHRNYIKQSSYNNYEYAVIRFKNFFENRPVAELQRSDVSSAFINMASEGCSASSIYNVRQIMGAVYSKAIEEHLTTINPFKKIRIPANASKKKVESYTLEEQSLLIEVAQKELLGEYYVFILHTGLRKGEFINLKWEDYDDINHTISIVQSKTNSGIRTLALSDTAEQILIKQQKNQHPFIFSTTKNSPISIASLNRLCQRLSNKVGFKVTCHRARHTFCTRMIIDAKIDAKTVCTLSGHKSVYFLMQRYVTSDLSKQRQALSSLDVLMK